MKHFLEIFKYNSIVKLYKECLVGKRYKLYEGFTADLSSVIDQVRIELDGYRDSDAEMYQIGHKLLITLTQIQNIIPMVVPHVKTDEELMAIKLENSIAKTRALLEQYTKIS